MTKGSCTKSVLKRLPTLFLCTTAFLWAGCGGNGGGAAPTPTPSPTSTSTPTITPTATTTLAPTVASPTPAETPGAGLLSTITDARIDASGSVQVTFTLTDGNGVPLTPVLSTAQSDRQARVRFVIAHLEQYSGGGESQRMFERYVNDINMTRPAFDSGGTLATVDPDAGIYRYTLNTKPADVDPALTYTVGMQIDREFEGQELGVNPIFDFVPQGGTPMVLESVSTQQCNSCHNPLIAHGNRREVRLCMLCHTEAAVDAPPPPQQPQSIDFRNMIHKIHAGQDLPSIVNGPPGSSWGIYSSFAKENVVFAQKDLNGNITGVAFPRTLESCTICHSNAPTANFYLMKAASNACATCHDDVNPSLTDSPAGPPGTNHVGNKGFADGDCATCHIPDSGTEFDISVAGAHTIPDRSQQLAGLNLEITGITNHAAGQTPTISFKITDNEGTPLTDLSGLDRVGFAIAGPTTDYESVMTPTAVGGGASGSLTGPDDSGVFQYTPTAAIPATATGTWSVGAEARRIVELEVQAGVSPKEAEEAAVNPVMNFTVDNSDEVPRRMVVSVDNCAHCHGQFSKDFSIHGNLRNQTTYCVLCHNPNNSDVARRKQDPNAVAMAEPVTPIDFKVMIHKIHRGENLEQKPYLIYGFGPPPANYSIVDFSNLLFPGDLRDCATCHVDSTYLIPPFPDTALGTQVGHLDPATGNEIIDGRIGPIQAVCTACHDGEDAVAHAQAQTASDGVESCPVCHEEGRPFAVSLLHAGRN